MADVKAPTTLDERLTKVWQSLSWRLFIQFFFLLRGVQRLLYPSPGVRQKAVWHIVRVVGYAPAIVILRLKV